MAVLGLVLVHLVFAYVVFWLAGVFVASSIRSATDTPILLAVVGNAALISVFGLQHSGMARRAFKSATARVVAPGLERAVYVWAAVAALFLLVALYQPINVTIWHVHSPVAQAPIWLIFIAGWTISAAAYWSAGVTFLLGLDQAWAWFRGAPQPQQPLVEGYAYRFVRNPQQLGLLLAFWATPHMTVGQLVFAGGLTAYICIGMALEEKDLTHMHGADYLKYRDRVPRILPHFTRRG